MSAAVVALTDRVPLQGMSTPDLESALLGLAGHIAAAQCRFLQLLAEFDRRDGWAGPGVRSCAHWLSWRAGMSLRTAAEHVRVAYALEKLPRIAAAFAAGRISYSKVRAITRITDTDAATIDTIAAATTTTTATAATADVAAAGTVGTAAAGTVGTAAAGTVGTAADGTVGTAAAGIATASTATAGTAGTATASTATAGTAGTATAGTATASSAADSAPITSSALDPAGVGSAGVGSAGVGPAGVGPAGVGPVGLDPAGRQPAGITPAGSDRAVVDPALADRVLLDLALSGTASHVETVVRAVRRRRTPPEDTAARRGLSWHWDPDGSLVVRGRFTPEQGATLIAAVQALVPPRDPIHHPVPDPPEDWQERAVEQEPGPAADRVAARRADALLALVTGETDTGDSEEGGQPAAPVVARGRTDVVVHLDATTATARIDGGPELPASTAERLACDARVQLLLHDRHHNRLYLGRSRRLASPAQIAALTARDGGRCQFPGCSHPRHLHAHHVRSWLRGGRTDIDNLILICGFHHRVIHDHGYRIQRLPGRWEFRRPDGTAVPAAATPLTGDLEGLIEINARARLRITRDTLTPDWGGERLDPEPILDALLPRHATAAA